MLFINSHTKIFSPLANEQGGDIQSVLVRTPATVANMVCGFDILGFAVEEPYDTMQLSKTNKQGLTIIHEDNYGLSCDPSQNVAGVALLSLLEEASLKNTGLELRIHKQIKPGSGVGSSAASAAGAVVAANVLLQRNYQNDDLVRFAMNGEKLASGVKHADNIAPCIYGGVTLIRSIFPLDIISLPSPDLFVTIVHPQIEVRTSDARSILKQNVQLRDAIRQWGNIGGLVAGLMKGDHALIGRSLEDVLIEPVRSILIPGFDAVKKKSKEAGALGGGISGSGPSIFMLSSDYLTALHVEEEMKAIYSAMALDYHTYVTRICSKGITVTIQ
jgi:homoserine kinase